MRRFLSQPIAVRRRYAHVLTAERSHAGRTPTSFARCLSGDVAPGDQQASSAPAEVSSVATTSPLPALSDFEGTLPEWIVVDGKMISRRKMNLEPLNDGDAPSELEVAWHPSQAVLDERFYSQRDKNRVAIRKAMEIFQDGTDADTGKSEVQGESRFSVLFTSLSP